MTTANLIPDLQRDEGFRLFPYRDSRGIWSIYTGHNIEADPQMLSRLPQLQQYGGTVAEGAEILQEDINRTETGLDRMLPWWRKLDDVRQDAFVNLAFNLGDAKLATWRHTDDDIMNNRFKAAEIDLENDEPWASQVHARATRIALQIETGIHQP